MFPEQIIAIIREVINVCKNEQELIDFSYAIMGENAFPWIFRHPVLRQRIDVPQMPTGRVEFSMALIDQTVQDIAQRWSWDRLSEVSRNDALATATVPPPAEVVKERRRFARDLIGGLAKEVPGYFKCTSHRVSELTLTAEHEANVTFRLFEDRSSCAAWQICGETADNWGDRATVCQNFLAELDKFPTSTPATVFAVMSKHKAQELFGNLPANSGNSCLVGIMVCDMVLSNGKKIRALSLSANMATLPNKTRVGQQEKGQGESQMHMEIFHIERLNAVLAALTLNPQEATLKSLDIAILGLKTNNVVEEAGMCKACAATMRDSIVIRKGISVGSITHEVYLIGP